MEKIYFENSRKLSSNKKKLENTFNVRIDMKANIVSIEGEPADELTALLAIEALDMGFQIINVLDLKNDEFTFEKISIKSLTKRQDRSQIRARIIGTNGRALENIEYLTDCSLVLHGNQVGIIGKVENVRMAADAITRLVEGSKHSNVYAYLEKQKSAENIKPW